MSSFTILSKGPTCININYTDKNSLLQLRISPSLMSLLSASLPPLPSASCIEEQSVPKISSAILIDIPLCLRYSMVKAGFMPTAEAPL